jgi:uncharacterized protein (TIGR03083 family)
MTMTQNPPRQATIEGAIAEYGAFAALLDGLTPAQWETATRCTGWRVRDVAGHVLGGAADIIAGAVGGRTADEQARAHGGGSPVETARDLREASGRVRKALERLDDAVWSLPSPMGDRNVGEAVLSLWHDTFVHADDIRAALGLPPDRGPGLEATVRWLRLALERRGWGPARLVLDGLGTYAIGEGGPELRGDPMTFVLVATGRAEPERFGADAGVNVYA